MDAFTYRDGELFAEGVALSAIASRFGTPTYVYSRAHIEAQYRSYADALQGVPHLVCYAVKANSNLAVLNLLPIPVLDGGLILFALYALIFRRRVPERVVAVLSTGFMFLLLGSMGILIFRDAHRSWRIHTYKPDAAETVEADVGENTGTNGTDNASN